MAEMKVAHFHKFKIEHFYKDGVNVGNVFIDGQQMLGVRSIDISIGVDRIPTVKLEFTAFDIEADTEVKMDG